MHTCIVVGMEMVACGTYIKSETHQHSLSLAHILIQVLALKMQIYGPVLQGFSLSKKLLWRETDFDSPVKLLFLVSRRIQEMFLVLALNIRNVLGILSFLSRNSFHLQGFVCLWRETVWRIPTMCTVTKFTNSTTQGYIIIQIVLTHIHGILRTHIQGLLLGSRTSQMKQDFNLID